MSQTEPLERLYHVRVVVERGSHRDALELRPRLLACARRVLRDEHEAEDVVQEALLRLGDEAPRSVEGWLYATCYRLAIDRLRARRRRERLLREQPREPWEDGAEVERALDYEEVRACLEALDDPYRTALTLRYLEGLEFAEVARRMKAIERTTRTWVGRGLSRLRERLARRP